MGCSCGCDSCGDQTSSGLGYDRFNPTRRLPAELPQVVGPRFPAGAEAPVFSNEVVPFAYGPHVVYDPIVSLVDQHHALAAPLSEAEREGAHRQFGSAADLIESQRAHGLDGQYGGVHRRRLARSKGYGGCFMPLEYALFADGAR